MKTINMNAKGAEIFLGFLPHGQTKLQVKLGRKLYILEIDKNIIDAHITLQNVGSFCCRSDALLTREVLDNVTAIQQAQFVQHHFRAIL